jgi:hypothetical protein
MEKRSACRTWMSLDFSTRMVLGGETFTGVPVANLGPRGCCVRLPATAAPHLVRHAPIDGMELSGSAAGPFPLQARIAWHDAPRFGGGRWINAGVEFLEAPAGFTQEWRDRVAGTLAGHGSMNRPR